MSGHISTLCFKFYDVVLKSYSNQRLWNFREWRIFQMGSWKIKEVVLVTTDQFPSLPQGIMWSAVRQEHRQELQSPTGRRRAPTPLCLALANTKAATRQKGRQEISSTLVPGKALLIRKSKRANCLLQSFPNMNYLSQSLFLMNKTLISAIIKFPTLCEDTGKNVASHVVES